MKDTDRYQIFNDSIVYRVINKEAVMLNVDNGWYYGLNETGSVIWNYLVKNISIGAIIDDLKDEYNVKEEKLKKDISKLIIKLKKEQLITLAEPKKGLDNNRQQTNKKKNKKYSSPKLSVYSEIQKIKGY